MTRRPSFPARLDLGSPVLGPRAVAVAQAARPAVAPAPAAADFSALRARMVRRLAESGIASQPLLQAMGAVPRDRFVDSALVAQAYEETSLPIGLNQTISKPQIVARMCELLLAADTAREAPLGRVLEVGTGCGYQAAVLSRLVREVYSIERLRGLHERARENLRPYRLANVHLLFGDGMAGYAKGAPYAGIVAAAGGNALPPAWLEQLAVGGRLVAPLLGGGGQQMLMVVDRTAKGYREQQLEAVHFVPLKSGIG